MAATAYHINITYAGIANDSMSDEHRAVLSHDPRSPEYMMRVNGSKMQLGCWIAYAMVLWCLKGSLLYFFLGRLTVRFFLPPPSGYLCGRVSRVNPLGTYHPPGEGGGGRRSVHCPGD